MQGNRGRDTRPELALRSALHRRGLRFFKNRRPELDVSCRADVVFPAARVAVFLDGCFWHQCPDHGTAPGTNSTYWRAKLDRNVARDRRNDADLRAAGWRVVRVWEHEEPDAAAEVIAEFVRRAAAEEAGHRRPLAGCTADSAGPAVGRVR
jgi:DNA mismatch endonuclease, patch repair protein